MREMFYNCSSLVSINLSNFNTCNVTDMNSMFYSCSSLIDLNLSNFNTINVDDMINMFYNCKSLKNLDLSNFIASKDTKLSNMFDKCESLSNLVTNSDEILDEYKKTNGSLINEIDVNKPKKEKKGKSISKYIIHTENSSNDYSKEKNNNFNLHTQSVNKKIKLKPINKIDTINIKKKNNNFNLQTQSVNQNINHKPVYKKDIKEKKTSKTPGKKMLKPLNKYNK